MKGSEETGTIGFDKRSMVANKDFFKNRVYSNPFLCYENLQNCPVMGRVLIYEIPTSMGTEMALGYFGRIHFTFHLSISLSVVDQSS
jgi:hypothetical protein